MDEVDYVIVGAGSAGCVMANRLSANGHHQVLLLEAGGGDARMWIKIPVGYAMTFSDPTLNWGYMTEADTGLSGRQSYWPRGACHRGIKFNQRHGLCPRSAPRFR
ncbi:NAD(P)-binding protein [Roseovarius nitratireducens]|uniref:NAD(P)-binding protein n=1 Tax=Roseovarius nitratireducens TaxID=2044597 RepID=UPI0030B800B5